MTPERSRDVLNGDWSDRKAPLDTCQICQRFQPLVWHCTSEAVNDRAHCRRTAGAGVCVCSLCEEALHQWMRKHPSEDAGRMAVTALLTRLSDRLLCPARKYTKRRDIDEDE